MLYGIHTGYVISFSFCYRETVPPKFCINQTEACAKFRSTAEHQPASTHVLFSLSHIVVAVLSKHYFLFHLNITLLFYGKQYHFKKSRISHTASVYSDLSHVSQFPWLPHSFWHIYRREWKSVLCSHWSTFGILDLNLSCLNLGNHCKRREKKRKK